MIRKTLEELCNNQQAEGRDLKKLFTERLNGADSRLKEKLARHYQTFIKNLSQEFEKLLDEVSATIKKDPDRVSLPVKLLTGSDQESEEEARQRCLLAYFRQYDTVRKHRDDVAPHFPDSGR